VECTPCSDSFLVDVIIERTKCFYNTVRNVVKLTQVVRFSQVSNSFPAQHWFHDTRLSLKKFVFVHC